jgi:hypothetical protein
MLPHCSRSPHHPWKPDERNRAFVGTATQAQAVYGRHNEKQFFFDKEREAKLLHVQEDEEDDDLHGFVVARGRPHGNILTRGQQENNGRPEFMYKSGRDYPCEIW